MESNNRPLRLLLVEGSQDNQDKIYDILRNASDFQFDLKCVESFDNALLELDPEEIDILLVSQEIAAPLGSEVIRSTTSNGYQTGVVVLTHEKNEAEALQAVKDQIAGDYLVWERLTASGFQRAIVLARRMLKLHRELDEHRRRLVQMVTTDTLTGLPNRHYLLERLTLETLRAKRYGHSLSIALIDSDQFMRVTDEIGHVVGDEMLAQIGRTLDEGLRATDLAGRFSGHKFLVVLNETDAAGANIFAHRISDRIAHTVKIGDAENPMDITCSIGIAQLDEYTPDVDVLVNAAQGALRTARMRGEGKIIIAGDQE